MRHTVNQTAVLLATVLARSEQTRARISANTIKVLGKRNSLRLAFFASLATEMVELGWALFEIESGYAAVKLEALQAAKPVTAKKWLSASELKALDKGTIDLVSLEEALEEDSSDEEQEDAEAEE